VLISTHVGIYILIDLIKVRKNVMRTVKVVTIICWALVGVVLMGLVGWFITGTVFGIRPAWIDRNLPFRINIGSIETLIGPFSIVGEHSVNPDDISAIQIDWVAGDVTIRPFDGDEIKIIELAQRNLHSSEVLSFEVSQTTLEINFLEHNARRRIGVMPQKRLELFIPYGLAAGLGSLNVGSVSGNVDVDGVDAYGMLISAISISTTSGNIALSNIESEQMETNSTSGSTNVTSSRIFSELLLSSTSGAIRLSSSASEAIEINTTSGLIDVQETSARALDADSTSGEIRVDGAFDVANFSSSSGRISLENSIVRSVANAGSTSGRVSLSGAFYSVRTNTTSGTVDIRSIIVPSAVHVHSVSGAVTIYVPSEDSIAVSHSSISGRFNSDIPVVIQPRDGPFDISTTSGNISIRELR